LSCEHYKNGRKVENPCQELDFSKNLVESTLKHPYFMKTEEFRPIISLKM